MCCQTCTDCIFSPSRWSPIFLSLPMCFCKSVTRTQPTTGRCCPTVCFISIKKSPPRGQIQTIHPWPLSPTVCLHFRFGCGGRWQRGPAATELPGFTTGANGDRQHDPGYNLDEKWSGGRAARELVCGAAGGKLWRGQLQLPQQGRFPPESHHRPDQGGMEGEQWGEEDSCENWPRYCVIYHYEMSVSHSSKKKEKTFQRSAFSFYISSRLDMIVCGSSLGDYLRCLAQNYNGEFHCSWIWNSMRVGEVVFIEAGR